jgi:hypothetical protein
LLERLLDNVVIGLSGEGIDVMSNESAQPETSFSDTQMLEFAVRTVHGVGINGHLSDDVSHGG